MKPKPRKAAKEEQPIEKLATVLALIDMLEERGADVGGYRKQLDTMTADLVRDLAEFMPAVAKALKKRVFH